jgi:hypothetical protein
MDYKKKYLKYKQKYLKEKSMIGGDFELVINNKVIILQFISFLAKYIKEKDQFVTYENINGKLEQVFKNINDIDLNEISKINIIVQNDNEINVFLITNIGLIKINGTPKKYLIYTSPELNKELFNKLKEIENQQITINNEFEQKFLVFLNKEKENNTYLG